MNRIQNDPDVRGAAMAAQFAQEIGETRQLWQAPVARHIAADLREYTAESVESHWRTKLGLVGVAPS